MLTSFLKTAIRSILRERQYALIKIIGLSLGLGTSMVLLLYISHQLSFDSMHRDVSRMYRVNQSNIWDPNGGILHSTGPAVSFALRNDFPEIEDILRINTPGSQIVRYVTDADVIAFNEDKVLCADSNFFSFFNIKLKEGNPQTALVGKNKVVLSDKAALRLFGDQSAIGKIVEIGDDRIPVEVSGVTEEQPTNMHFRFDYLLSIYTNPSIKEFEWSWIWTQVVTYVKLHPGVNAAQIDEKLKTFANRHAPATFKRLQMDYMEFINEKGPWLLYLQPVKDIHLYSASIGNRLGPVGDIDYVYILSVIAVFILLIAVINFINLSTARATNRAKEVGVKKTLGLLRGSLIAQFQIEHILLTIVSMLLGLGVMEILRLLLQPIVNIPGPLTLWNASTFVIMIVIIPCVIGFLAGLYPSFYLTSFSPSEVLKGKLASGMRSSKMRNGLVVFQFTISIALMAATLIVFQQLDFFQSRSVGFAKENLLVVSNAEKLGDQLESFRNEVATYAGVASASVSNDIRGGFEDIYMREGDMKQLSISGYKVDEHFFETTKIQLVSGRTFDYNRPSDKNAVIINETTARFFDWTPETALGKRIIYLGDDMGPQEVIGVAKDFHFASLHQNIMPFMFFNRNSSAVSQKKVVLIRYDTKDAQSLIGKIESRWNKLVEATPFISSFYEEEVKMRYQQEQRMASLFTVFTGLSITIAVIGLVGLVSYSAEQRKKEIGIRKVFGASLARIYIMINTQYLRLLCISLLIATPIAWLLMQQWLNSFPYRVTVNPLVFAISGWVELVLALICVSYLALRAASLSPATVLKDE